MNSLKILAIISGKVRMDNIDRKILDIIQADFPLSSRPYAVIGEKAGICEEEAFSRVMKMKEDGIIRRIGANFQSGKLGFASTLCAARVPEDKKERFIKLVNARPGVTHNYEREHEYNIWFTLIGKNRETVCRIIEEISLETGIKILNLPAEKMFKIKVDFSMSETE